MLPSMGVGMDTNMGTNTGVIDNTFRCLYDRSYGCSKVMYGL